MKIEHFGIACSNPVEIGKWYSTNFNFEILISGDDGCKGVTFLKSNENGETIEFFKLPEVQALSETLVHHLQFHIAFESDDPIKKSKELVEVGAEFVEECPNKMSGDFLVVLHDPWRNTIQLVSRKIPLEDK